MKIIVCDQCGDQFDQPLDEERYTDEHGIVHVFDLCAPCRQKIAAQKDKGIQTIFEKLLKGNNG